VVIYELMARKKHVAALKEKAAQRKVTLESERQEYLARVFDEGESRYGVVLELVRRRRDERGG
jgi:hypothetical protein